MAAEAAALLSVAALPVFMHFTKKKNPQQMASWPSDPGEIARWVAALTSPTLP